MKNSVTNFSRQVYQKLCRYANFFLPKIKFAIKNFMGYNDIVKLSQMKGENLMENKIQVFSHEDFGQLRTMKIDGEIYFLGKDVAKILGYKDTDKAIREHVDDEDKQLLKPADFAGKVEKSFESLFKAAGYNWKVVPATIPPCGLIFINNAGLHSLVFSSKLPAAKKFKRWVTSEVLPSIRKTDSYTAENSQPPKDDWPAKERAELLREIAKLTRDDSLREKSLRRAYELF